MNSTVSQIIEHIKAVGINLSVKNEIKCNNGD